MSPRANGWAGSSSCLCQRELTCRWRGLRQGTLVCQPPVFGQDHPGVVATVAEVGIDGSGRVTNYAVRSVDLETDHPEDADMLRWLSEY
jgi:hypothetical protein